MAISKEARENIAQNANLILSSSVAIVSKVAAAKGLDHKELRHMEITALANISIALGTLLIFAVENADSNKIIAADAFVRRQ